MNNDYDVHVKHLLIELEEEAERISDGLQEAMPVHLSLQATSNALKILVELLRYMHLPPDIGESNAE